MSFLKRHINTTREIKILNISWTCAVSVIPACDCCLETTVGDELSN